MQGNSQYRGKLPQHPVFNSAQNALNHAADIGFPEEIRKCIQESHTELCVEYKAVMCIIAMSWIIRAAITTGTVVKYELIKFYTIVISRMCLARISAVTAEELTTRWQTRMKDDTVKLVKDVKAAFGDRLPPELPLPRTDQKSPWLSPEMWRSVE